MAMVNNQRVYKTCTIINLLRYWHRFLHFLDFMSFFYLLPKAVRGSRTLTSLDTPCSTLHLGFVYPLVNEQFAMEAMAHRSR